jgi:prolipoprotein diacylglyceryltransferase
VGTSFTLAVIAFAISRFGYEFLRAGTAEEYELGLASGRTIPSLGVTEAQIASLVLALIGVVWLIVRRGSAPPATPPAAPEA